MSTELPDDLVNGLTIAVQRAGELLLAMPLEELEEHYYGRFTEYSREYGTNDRSAELLHVVDMIAVAQSLARVSAVVARDAEQHERRRSAAELARSVTERARTIAQTTVEQVAGR